MMILDVLSSPWAIQQEKLDQITAIYDARVRGEMIDLQAVEASLGRPLNNERKPYEVVNGVALIPVQGVLAKRANLFMQISGGMSMQMIQRDIARAEEDPDVRAVIGLFDTPGGTVDGTQATAKAFYRLRGKKPTATLADGVMASAGVWIGSAAEERYIADLTTIVGSIGVVAQHIDRSAYDKAIGVKRTEIYAGKYKRINSDTGPLTEEGRAYMQDSVDHLYSVFVDDVATFLGQTPATVLNRMADGRLFTGQQAIDAGLVDGVITLDALIEKMAAKASTHRAISARPVQPPKGKNMAITKEQVTAEAPEVAEALRAEGRAEAEAKVAEQHQAAIAEVSANAAKAERDRILGVEAAADGFPGHEKLVAELKADGKTSPDQASSKILAAERAALSNQSADLKKDAPAPVQGAVTENEASTEKPDSKQLAQRAETLRKEAMAKGEHLSYSQAVALARKAS